MHWIYLLLAGLFEVGFTTCLKMSENFTKGLWALGFVVCVIGSFYFLNKAIQAIPIGTAYAVWTGIGGAGTVIIGMMLFKEPVQLIRLFFIGLLIFSIVGLKTTI